MVVYLDLVMLLNFLVDFFLLLGTNRLAGFPSQFWRCGGAALLGASYSGACLLPGMGFLGNLLWRCVCLGLMGILAFGWNPAAGKRTGIFLLLTMAMGGAALCLGRGDFLSVVLCALICLLLSAVSFGDWCFWRFQFCHLLFPKQLSSVLQVLGICQTAQLHTECISGWGHFL